LGGFGRGRFFLTDRAGPGRSLLPHRHLSPTFVRPSLSLPTVSATIAALYSDHSFAVRYSQLTDHELLVLSEQSSDLTSSAVSALQEELVRRGLEVVPVNTATGQTQSRAEPPEWLPNPESFWNPLKIVVIPATHFLLAVLVLPLSARWCFYLTRPVLSFFLSPEILDNARLLYLPLFLLQVTIALIAGLCLGAIPGKFWNHRSAEWVWVPPTIWLSMWLTVCRPTSVMGETVWQHLFWSNNPFARLLQIRATLPGLSAIGYALGHFIGRHTLPVSSPISTVADAR